MLACYQPESIRECHFVGLPTRARFTKPPSPTKPEGQLPNVKRHGSYCCSALTGRAHGHEGVDRRQPGKEKAQGCLPSTLFQNTRHKSEITRPAANIQAPPLCGGSRKPEGGFPGEFRRLAAELGGHPACGDAERPGLPCGPGTQAQRTQQGLREARVVRTACTFKRRTTHFHFCLTERFRVERCINRPQNDRT